MYVGDSEQLGKFFFLQPVGLISFFVFSTALLNHNILVVILEILYPTQILSHLNLEPHITL